MNNFEFKIITNIIFLFIFTTIAYSNVDLKIKYKINDQIVTNIDLQNEKRFLIFLNPNLRNLSNTQLENISNDSYKNRKIKEIELRKYFDFEKKNLGEKYIEQFVVNSNFDSKDELLIKLKNENLNYEDFRKNFFIDNLWREFIFGKFKSQIKINIDELKKQINAKETNIEELNLSEILFKKATNISLNEIKDKIYSEIDKSGFEAAASIYSISESKKFGGKLGWIKSNQISEKIYLEIKKGNNLTQPIKTTNGYLIVKVNGRRNIKGKVNLDEELKKLINTESQKEINKLGYIYFNKIKKRTFISEN
tara:strand:+ start:563 stop:1486 length:924 start_codon:yes stop_codon:yes gene_type:complete